MRDSTTPKTTMTDLDDIRQRTKSASEYLHGLTDKWKEYEMERYEKYNLDSNVVEELKKFVADIVIVLIGASWCKDCREAVPVLMKLEEEMGLEVRIFGTVKTAPLNPDVKWKVPPSPPETIEWGVTAIPWIVIFKKDGTRVGTIIEKQTIKPTLEAEILQLLKG